MLCLVLSFVICFCQNSKAQNQALKEKFRFQLTRYSPEKQVVKTEFNSAAGLQIAIEKEMDRWVNSGYPFAQIRFDTILFDHHHTISAVVDPGPPVINGSVVNHGDTSLKIEMIARWIRMKKDQPFVLSRFRRIPVFLRQLPFATSVGDMRLEWFGEKAIVHLNLQRQRVNSFSGILGFLPQPEGGGATILTGNIDASLKNLFGQAIGLDLKWNRFAPSSQIANIKLSAPSITYSGLGVESVFDLFRQDSVLSKQRFEARLVSNPNGLWNYKVGFATSGASTRLGVSGGGSESVSTQAVSLQVSYDPFEGAGIVLKKKTFQATLLPAYKKVQTNAKEVNEPQIEIQILAMLPLPIKSERFAVIAGTQLSGIWSDIILLPDQFRMGGIRTIRGFNENFFFTTHHALFSIQPQFLVDKSFLLNAFVDYMLFNPKPEMKHLLHPDFAFGSGLGMELEIGANLVRISVANGFATGVPFDFQSSKIHFGYIARF